MSSSCPGFKPQGVRPTKCRRCFKDIADHNISLETLTPSYIGFKRTSSRSTLIPEVTDEQLKSDVKEESKKSESLKNSDQEQSGSSSSGTKIHRTRTRLNVEDDEEEKTPSVTLRRSRFLSSKSISDISTCTLREANEVASSFRLQISKIPPSGNRTTARVKIKEVTEEPEESAVARGNDAESLVVRLPSPDRRGDTSQSRKRIQELEEKLESREKKIKSLEKQLERFKSDEEEKKSNEFRRLSREIKPSDLKSIRKPSLTTSSSAVTDKESKEIKEKMAKLEETKKDFETKYNEAKKKISELESELKKSEKKQIENVAQLSSAQERIKILETEVSSKRKNSENRLLELEAKVKKLETENSSLKDAKEKLTVSEDKVKKLQKRLDNAIKETKQVQLTLEVSQEKLSKLEDEIKRKEKENRELKALTTSQKEKLTELEEKTKTLDKESRENQEFQKRLKIANQKLSEFEERVRKLEEEKKSLETKINSMQKAQQASESERQIKLTESLSAAEDKVKQLTDQVKSMEKVSSERQKGLTEAEKLLEKEKKALEEDLKRSKRKCEELEDGLQRMEKEKRTDSQRISRLEEDIKKLEKLTKESEEEKLALEKSVKKKEDEIKQIEKRQTELESIIKTKEGCIQTFEDACHQLEKEKKQLEDKFKSFEKEKKATKSELEKLEEKLKKLEKENKDLNSKMKEIQLKLSSSESKVEVVQKLEKEIEALKSKLLSKETEVDSLQKQIKDSEAKRKAIENELSDVQKKLKTVEDESKELRVKSKSTTAKLKEAEESLKKLETESKQLKASESQLTLKSKKLTESEEALSKLERDLKEMETKLKKAESDKKAELAKVTKLKEDLEKENQTIKNELKNLKVELQSARRPSLIKPTDSETVQSLKAKLKESQNLCEELQHENEEIKLEIKSLANELEELHDTFREDQASEFRDLKRELEINAKNVRVLQFKLKKSERTVEQLEMEKAELEKQMKDFFQASGFSVDRQRKSLEDELKIAKEVSMKLHSEIESLREEKFRSEEQTSKSPIPNRLEVSRPTSPLISPQPSFDSGKDYEEVVRSLYDTMEREKDLQEQLKFAEEECRTVRKKLSTMEQENEILVMQIRKMASKNKKQDVDEDSEELNPDEMKLHLELYEQEMTVLRKKTDELEQENENLHQEIKYLQEKLISQPLTKLDVPELPTGASANVIYQHKIKLLEIEARELRLKIVKIEKENETLRTELEIHRKKASKVMVRSKSLEGEAQVDLKRQIQLVEQEATILRQKVITLEADNEKLLSENKRLQLKVSRKPPPGPRDKLQLENLELLAKIKELESKCEAFKTELQETKSNSNLPEFLQQLKKLPTNNDKLAESESEFITSLKKQLSAKDEEIRQLQTKATQLEVDLSRADRQYRKLKDSVAFKRKPSKVIRESTTRLELKEIVKELEEELDLQSKAMKSKELQYEDLEQELIKVRREVDQLQTNLRKSEEKREQLSKKLLDIKLEPSQVIEKPSDSSVLNEKANVAKALKQIEELEHQKKELTIKLSDMENELSSEKRKTTQLTSQLKGSNDSHQEALKTNTKLSDDIRKLEEELKDQKTKLRKSENTIEEVQYELKQKDNAITTLKNDWNLLKSQLEDERKKSGTTKKETTGAFGDELRRQVQELKTKSDALQTELDTKTREWRQKENQLRDEQTRKLETILKDVRKEADNQLQSLRDENRTLKSKCNELAANLEKAEGDAKEEKEKNKAMSTQIRKEKDELSMKAGDTEAQLRTEQRKREKIEKEFDLLVKTKDDELLQSKNRVVQLERELRKSQMQLEHLEEESRQSDRSLTKAKQDYNDLTTRYEILEEEFVKTKSQLVTEKDTLVEAISTLKRSYDDKISEIKSFRDSYSDRQGNWIKMKLDLEERVKELESKLARVTEIEKEKNRAVKSLQEKEALLDRYRKHEKILKDENEDLRKKLTELDSKKASGRVETEKEIQKIKTKFEHSETSHKGDIAALHAEYEARMKLMGDEIVDLQRQIQMLLEEREQLRAKLLRDPKFRDSSYRNEVEDTRAQMESLRKHLEETLLENRTMKIHHSSEKSSWQITVAELKTRVCQLEEQLVLESSRGTARNYVKPKLELAWEKERQDKVKLLGDTQKLVDDLKNKLINLETVREKEKSEARKQLVELKNTMDKEQEETQKKITELQLDLIDLRDIHAKLKSQNERLKRERIAIDQEREAWRTRLFAAIDVQNKATELSTEMEKLTKLIPELATEEESKEISSKELSLDVLTSLKTIKIKINEIKNHTVISNSDQFKRSISFRRAISSTDMNAQGSKALHGLLPVGSGVRAPPRPKAWAKKSLSLEQTGGSASNSQERIWDSDDSIATTPASSVSNLRYTGPLFYHRTGISSISGYESEGSFGPDYSRWTREGSYGERSDVSAPATTGAVKPKKTLKDKFKILRSDQPDRLTEEKVKDREKKESSLRSRISKTLKKTLSRSNNTLSKEQKDLEEKNKSSTKLKEEYTAAPYGSYTLGPNFKAQAGLRDVRSKFEKEPMEKPTSRQRIATLPKNSRSTPV